VRWKEPLTREQVEESVGTTGGFTIPTWRQRGGLVWIVLLLVLVALVLSGGLPGRGNKGANLRRVLGPFPATPAPDGRSFGAPGSSGFVVGVASDVDQTWKELFQKSGVAYHSPKRIVYKRTGKSDCGVVRARTSDVYYCEYDEKLVLDGGIASAISVAHGYAHHIQQLLGITDQIRRAEKASPSQARDFWRRHELQADCLAGVWAHSTYPNLDVDAAIADSPAAAKPDHLVDPKHWAVAKAGQRRKWFRGGYEGGKPSACDTFSHDV
jgi:predicted metalloprotease